jgi:hypothetical protein
MLLLSRTTARHTSIAGANCGGRGCVQNNLAVIRAAASLMFKWEPDARNGSRRCERETSLVRVRISGGNGCESCPAKMRVQAKMARSVDSTTSRSVLRRRATRSE